MSAAQSQGSSRGLPAQSPIVVLAWAGFFDGLVSVDE